MTAKALIVAMFVLAALAAANLIDGGSAMAYPPNPCDPADSFDGM
jgi:hypothetical protein